MLTRCRELIFVMTVSTFVLGSITAQTFAQTKDYSTCPNPFPREWASENVTACMSAAAVALKAASDEIAALRAEISEAEEKTNVPAGAVMAFDLPNGCPRGWDEFTPAAGRFVIAVDGKKYRLPYEAGNPRYQKEGEESVELTLQQMPTHSHSFDIFAAPQFDNTGGATPQGGDYDSAFIQVDKGSTKPAGGLNNKAVPHNNMPPYIALYMCKKCASVDCR